MKRAIIFFIVWVVAIEIAGNAAAMDIEPHAPVIGAEEYTRLLAGEALTWLEQTGSREKEWVQAAILIKAPARRVWEVLTNCTDAAHIISGLKDCRVVTHDSNSDIVEQRIKVAWFLPTFTYIFKTRYHPYSRLEFRRIGGDFKELEGYWRFDAYPDNRHTLVIYSVYMKLGFFVPQWIVRQMLGRNLPQLLTDLRRQVTDPNAGGLQ